MPRKKPRFKVGDAYCYCWDTVKKFRRCWLIIAYIGDRYITVEYYKPKAYEPPFKEEYLFSAISYIEGGRSDERSCYKKLPNTLRDEIFGEFVDVKSIIQMYKLTNHLFDEDSFYAEKDSC